MASQEPLQRQSPNASDLEKRGDNLKTSTTSSNPDGESNDQQNEEAREAPSIPTAATQNKEPEYAHDFKLFNILAAVTLVCFLMLLDGTIVVAAAPRITDDFNSLDDIGWYGAAYQLGRYVRKYEIRRKRYVPRTLN